MNLPLKYRPKTFDEFIGNRELIESLKSVFSRKEKPHTYLFYGDRGCGKTTLARICAREVGASDINIIEINTSNNRGIDTARRIIDDMKFVPIDGTPRVYIIDEVHKTTNEWQNSMLKPLEDTGKYTYFFLCTTNPEKLLKPLRSRCMEFKVSSLKEKEMLFLLKKVSKREGFLKSKEVYLSIIDKVKGNPREGLILLEKIKDLDNNIAIKAIEEDFIEIPPKIIDFCRLLLKTQNWKQISSVLKELLKEYDPENIKRAVIGYMKSVLLNGNSNIKAAMLLEAYLDSLEQTWDSEGSLILATYIGLNNQ